MPAAITKRIPLFAMLLAAAASAPSAVVFAQGTARAEPTSKPPNVVLIISDDQAWGDFGFMGHRQIETPNLDRLARQSAVFHRGYVPTSLCRPSLATMATGLYPHQHKITGNDPPKNNDRARVRQDREAIIAHLDRARTLPTLLAERGYRSFQSGKWWEGDYRRGGFTHGMTHGDPRRGGRHGDAGLKIGRKGLKPIFDFIDEGGAQPFLLWYAPFLPHTPHNPPKRLLEKYQARTDSKHVAAYWAMCEWFDETCGELLGFLDSRQLRNNTLVLFVTDNGWIQRPDNRTYAARSKRSPYEGGVRTPILVRWPGHVKPGRRDQLASSIDLVPTALRAAGLQPPAELPGIDLVELAKDNTPRDTIFGEIFTHDAIDVDNPAANLKFRFCIRDRYKLIVPHGPNVPNRGPELYDVAADPHERKDLADSRPGEVEQLRGLLDRWWSP